MNDLGGPHTSPASDDHAFPARHPYPGEALDWLLPADATRIVDLGAGTGRLARQLHARGLDVTAVDPSAAMLAELRRTLPGVPTHIGCPEKIPLPDGSADVILAADIWHWSDPAQALPEVTRVLRVGGILGLVGNARDERTDWVASLGTIIGATDMHRDPRLGPPFGPADRATFPWSRPVRSAELIDLVSARGGMILLPADERAAVLAQIRQLMATHPALLGHSSHELPYVTICTRATRLS